MRRVLRSKTELVVPQSVRRRAGIKPGDELEFTASEGVITIRAVAPQVFRSVRAELTAIRDGRAEIVGGACVTLAGLLRDLDDSRQARGVNADREGPR
jgi:bifunctional DNA-binding transcriptional regulator/antitoxin component of YhaV-PrlF toxin-antitoxin module